MDLRATQFEATISSANQAYLPEEFRKKHSIRQGDTCILEFVGKIRKTLEEAKNETATTAGDGNGIAINLA